MVQEGRQLLLLLWCDAKEVCMGLLARAMKEKVVSREPKWPPALKAGQSKMSMAFRLFVGPMAGQSNLQAGTLHKILILGSENAHVNGFTHICASIQAGPQLALIFSHWRCGYVLP